MSMYGYSDALSQGSAFNARINNFNEGVLVHNQEAQDKYKEKIKEQPGKVSSDIAKKDEDAAFYGFKDGSGVIGTGVGVANAGQSIAKNGFKGYLGTELADRVNTIKSTTRAIVKGEPKPPPAAMELGEIGDDGKVVAGTAGRTVDEAATNVKTATNLVGDAGTAAEDTAKRESSGLMTAGIKKGLQLATAGKIGDAGLSALSEIGGKAIGDFSGALDVGKNISNLIQGKSVFSGEDTADKYQEAGAVLDVAGIAFPPLELVGGALNLTGGIMSAYTDLKGDLDKKHNDAAAPPPPKLTSVKVSPAFQSMGLVASQIPSAKNQIVGSGTF